MTVFSPSQWWRRSSAQGKKAPKRSPRIKCFLEVLEDRTLLSGNAYLVNLPGDAGNSSGQYSGDIRYCINQADKAANAGSTITFDTAITGRTITLFNELAITQNMTIQGPGASDLTIQAFRTPNFPTIFYNGVRVFDITSSSATVNISGLTITDGVAEPTSTSFLFPNGSQGGDIFNGGNLTLNNCIVSNGEALSEFGGPTGRGGGIFSAHGSTLTISNTQVINNLASGIGGLVAEGGGIYCDVNSSLYLTNTSQVSNNIALGLQGTTGFTGFTGFSGPAGGKGGPGTPGGSGGSASGGGIYFAGSSLNIEGTSAAPILISNNTAQGGNGGAGGAGGLGGKGSSGPGGTGGTGGAGGIGGWAIGGGFYASGGNLSLNGAQFVGNQALGGTGGKGGKGGKGGAGTPNGRGGLGGLGNNALQAEGGGIYNQGGSLSIGSDSLFTGNVVVSGAGGAGGHGGSGATSSAPGGNGGNAGSAAYGYGGAIAMLAGSLSISTTTFGGAAQGAGNVLVGGAGGAGGLAGLFALGGKAGIAAPAFGGAIFVGGNATNVLLSTDTFIANSVISGNGGDGGTGQNGQIGGAVGGGAVAYYLTQGSLTTKPTTFSVASSQFSQNQAGAGSGGLGAQGGNALPGYGGALYVYNQAGVTNVSINNSTFTRSLLQGGFGGSGGNAGNGSSVFGGAVAVSEAASAANSVSLTGCQLSNNTAAGGSGGSASTDGGVGGSAEGGGLYVSNGSLVLSGVNITSNVDRSGSGGFSFFGPGGDAGLAEGGGLSANAGTAPVSYLLYAVNITSNTLTQGAGGLAALRVTTPFFVSLGTGGNAGGLVSSGLFNGAWGAGAALVGGKATISNSHLDNNSGTAGNGGAGGTGTGTYAIGGNAGSGGSALGGGLFFDNNSSGALTLTFANSTATNNQMTAGTGGVGGRDGIDSSDYIPGGNGGQGGEALGGGIFLLVGALGSNTSTISSATLDGNTLIGGTGGNGGAGSSTVSGLLPGAFSAGGAGGRAAGGGIYNYDLNSQGSPSKLNINSSTMAGNAVTGGDGGDGGSGTTPTGGPGGNGGNGGEADGGGLCNDYSTTTLVVQNSTIGGLSNNGSIKNGNTLTGGAGGTGGDAGLPAGLTSADGGNGGNGGLVIGGGVFDDSGSTLFVNNTIVNNQGTAYGASGAGGQGAGTSATGGGQAGKTGKTGYGVGGGMFVTGASATVNAALVGNNIIDFNHVLSPGVVEQDDVSGFFQSEGNNILGSLQNTSGFGSSDQIGVTNAQLKLGALQNNGGPTPTCSLLPGSIAIDNGANTDLLSGSSTDQRGFSRIFNGNVDIGAYEYQAPSINNPGSSAGLVNNEGDQVSVTVTSTDANAKQWSAKGLPTGLSIDPNSGVIHGVIGANAAGTYSVTVSAKDFGTNGSITFIWTVNDSTPPGFTSPGNQASNAGDSINLTLSATDADSYSANNLPTGLSINPTTGVISGTIAASAAGNTYPVTLTITDAGVTSTVRFMWVVNQPGASSNSGSGNGANGGLPNGAFPIAGLLELALEEFQLTVDSFLANFYSSIGQDTTQLNAQAAQLTAAINGDPLSTTYWGQLAIQLGQAVAMGTA